jgi:murein DD-endopeptidase MepM/ murein hydrolase activator NlpD
VSSPRAAAVAVAGAILLVPAMGGAEPAAHVRPGTVVRWPGAGIESCTLGERSWTPLEGACFYPIDLLRPVGPLELARRRAGRREAAAVIVGAYDYPVQRLQMPRGWVELSPEDLARVKRENREIAPLWARTGPRRFALPLEAPLAPLPAGGRFGSRRIINGSPRSPHAGADYTVAAGTPVQVVADGVVAMVGDHFFGGNSVFVDHGDGLITLYLHLSRVDVREGQQVKRGDRLGAVGQTGRATGPHLHFGLRWHGARVDPALLLADPGTIRAID